MNIRLSKATLERERRKLEAIRMNLAREKNDDVSDYCYGAVAALDWILSNDSPPHRFAEYLMEKRNV